MHYVTIDTPGLDSGDSIVHYCQNGYWKWGDVVDSQWKDAVDYGTEVTILDVIDGSHYTTPDQNQFWIVEPQFLEVQYYQQNEVEIETTGLPWSSPATVYYTANGSAQTGLAWDGYTFHRWVDNDTIVGIDEIVTVDGDERFHTAGDTNWYVGSDLDLTVEYHLEILITVESSGLGPPLDTHVTIGTANPGMDMDDFVVPLSETNGYSWQGWVHHGTTLTARDSVEASQSEKYVAVLWTENGEKHPPPIVIADEAGLLYTIHYAGLKKEMSSNLAGLTDTVTVYINVSMPPDPGPGTITIVDNLPNEFSYILKSARMDCLRLDVNVTEMEACGIKYQRLSFEMEAGDHEISYAVKINRAYATDTTVHNSVMAMIDLDEFDPVTVAVMDDLVIKVYYGPTLSSSMNGPSVLFLRNCGCWEFTFIVKNNFDYDMVNAVLMDYFNEGFASMWPIFCYDIYALANPNTDYDFAYSYYYSKLRLTWTIGDIEKGGAFMFQVKLCAVVPLIVQSGYGMSGYQTLYLDSGAMLNWEDYRGWWQWMRISPMKVYIKPLWYW
jgi:hypothetical protein